MIVFLNNEYLHISEAKVSPLDRGFLFGDGIYEVTPSYEGRMVGFDLHLQRMKSGLESIGITGEIYPDEKWLEIAKNLSERNGGGNLGLYFHVSRGNEGRRFHGFPEKVEPTVFCMTMQLPDSSYGRCGLKAVTEEDMRWRRCNVKSTALLGNVLHFQQGYQQGQHETILFNTKGELTEASSSNVFIVKEGVVSTPLLDNQKLPGISRHILLSALRSEGSIPIQERVITMDEVRSADEVWITNSGIQMAPIIELDGHCVGSGKTGEVWKKAIDIYESHKFEC